MLNSSSVVDICFPEASPCSEAGTVFSPDCEPQFPYLGLSCLFTEARGWSFCKENCWGIRRRGGYQAGKGEFNSVILS